MSYAKLHPRLQDIVKDKKWNGLTDIQNAAFDPIFQGISCTIEAPTSGGKTEAVLFPLLTRISGKKKSGFKVLYIAPLKALLNDLDLRVSPYAEKCYLKGFKWHGDVSQTEKMKQMDNPADILLTTPESLEAILLRKPNKEDIFKHLETVVIDEAHYFALTERGSHLLSVLERISAFVPTPFQRIAVTATIGNPINLLLWLTGKKDTGQPISVKATKVKEKDFKIHFLMDDGLGFQDQLYNLLSNKKSIVFERSRTRTEETATSINERNQLTQSRFPVKVKTHHSSVSKRFREEAEYSIKKDSLDALNAIISTSTLELGIDIGHLEQVIQVGGLVSTGSFLQRVGRTGRRDGQSQFFRGLCFDSEGLLLLTGCMSLGLKSRAEAILFPTKAFHILAHQIICMCLQNNGVTVDQIWPILSKAYCFSGISKSQLDQLISFMVEENYLRIIDGSVILAGLKSEDEFLRANWKRLFAIFDTGPIYNVVDGKKIVGSLDSAFARSQQLPFIFVLGGQEWNAIKIDHEMQQILVEKNHTGVAPKWNSLGNIDVPFELAQEIGKLLSSREPLPFLDPPALIAFEREREQYCYMKWSPGKWIMESTSEDSQVIHIWNFAGDKINRALKCVILSAFGEKPSYDYRGVSINLNKYQSASAIKESIYELLGRIRIMTDDEIISYMEKVVDPKWFSKFSECLPDRLARLTIIEKDLDLTGLIREVNVVAVDY